MIPFKKFKIVRCKKCSQLQVMGGTNFKCKICNTTTKLKLKSKFGLNLNVIKSFDTGTEAEKFLKCLNEEKMKPMFIGFRSYGVDKDGK